MLPASGPSRGHAKRVLERAGFRLSITESLDEALEAGRTDPTVCCVAPVDPPEVDENVASDAWLEGRSLAEIERKAFLDTLEATGGNRAAAARKLCVSEKTVYNKLRAWGMPNSQRVAA